jgi:hypothetical protein
MNGMTVHFWGVNAGGVGWGEYGWGGLGWGDVNGVGRGEWDGAGCVCLCESRPSSRKSLTSRTFVRR